MNLQDTLSTMPVFVLGLGASVAASLGTGAGALPVLAFGRASQRSQDVLQSIAAGIMLAATVMSLVIPGVEAGARQHGFKTVGALIVAAAVFIGALAILLIHRHSPHEHFLVGRDGPAATRLRRTWLFVIAITLHNFPEGMAVGVGFGGGDVANGLALSSAIFVQNLPEGFLVALGLLAAGYGKPFSIFASFATGLVETAGGLVGAAAVATAVTVLPWAMGFAAGAMLFVISPSPAGTKPLFQNHSRWLHSFARFLHLGMKNQTGLHHGLLPMGEAQESVGIAHRPSRFFESSHGYLLHGSFPWVEGPSLC